MAKNVALVIARRGWFGYDALPTTAQISHYQRQGVTDTIATSPKLACNFPAFPGSAHDQ